jgi:hypothetical protein
VRREQGEVEEVKKEKRGEERREKLKKEGKYGEDL